MKHETDLELVPAFLGDGKITHLFQDQYDHIVVPVMEDAERILSGNLDPRMATLDCKPGSGKTTVFNIDLVFRIAALAVKKNIRNQLIVITAPDKTIIQDNLELFERLYRDQYVYDFLIGNHNVNFTGVHENPSDILGRGLEIVCCTIQKATIHQNHHLEKHDMLMMLNDEIHSGLGCPDGQFYPQDIGRPGKRYEAIWFKSVNKLNPLLWYGMSGTHTHSVINNKDYYYNISNKMERSDWRLPFFKKHVLVFDENQLLNENYESIIKEYFIRLSKRNAISKYIHSKIPEEFLKDAPLSKLNRLKTSGMIICGTNASHVPSPRRVNDIINGFNKQLREKKITFSYEGEVLEYEPVTTTIMTAKDKTGGSNASCIHRLNSEYTVDNSVATIQIGGVGVNIENMGILAVLPIITNPEGVFHTLNQKVSRLDRNAVGIWRGEFDIAVAKIDDAEIRDLIIKLAVHLASKEVIATDGGMIFEAYDAVKTNHVIDEDAYGYLCGLVSLRRKKMKQVARYDDLHKRFKKDHCERCEKHLETGIPMCEYLARSRRPEMSDSEFKEYWRGCLDVHHIDGDHTNNKPGNHLTVCKNEHQFTTMEEEHWRSRKERGLE